MSGYGSPSLVKMEASSRRGRRQKRQFSLGRILGDPFALATISTSIFGWLIAFVAGIVSKVHDYEKHHFPNFAWWTIAFYFLCILGIIITIAFDVTYHYANAITAFLAYALFLSTSAIDNTIWDAFGAHEAAAAGFILLAVVSVIWIFYFGSQPGSGHRGFIDSFALHGGQQGPMNSMRASNQNQFAQTNPPYSATHTYPRSQLGGLEASSPEPRYPEPPGSGSRQSPAPQQRGFGSPTSPNGYGMTQKQPHMETHKRDSDEPANNEYPYKARAIYSYDANPDDANEISFTKHEVLDVSDVSGRWWQAKKTNGETGIAPSNYLILL